jgi:hypothetical protein
MIQFIACSPFSSISSPFTKTAGSRDTCSFERPDVVLRPCRVSKYSSKVWQYRQPGEGSYERRSCLAPSIFSLHKKWRLFSIYSSSDEGFQVTESTPQHSREQNIQRGIEHNYYGRISMSWDQLGTHTTKWFVTTGPPMDEYISFRFLWKRAKTTTYRNDLIWSSIDHLK